MSSRNTPSKVEPDAKRHKLDDQNESSDDDDSIIDTTLASEDPRQLEKRPRGHHHERG